MRAQHRLVVALRNLYPSGLASYPFLPSSRAISLCIASYLLILVSAWAAPYIATLGPLANFKWPHYIDGLPWYTNWDGQWYYRIVEFGYEYDSTYYSSIAFYPLYPAISVIIKYLTGLSSMHSMMVVNLISLLMLCGIMESYSRQYFGQHSLFAFYVLCLVLFWPSSYFLRVTYPISLLMFLMCLMFYGFRAQWRLRSLTFICALLSACHSTGVMFVPTLGYHAWNRLQHLSLFPRLIRVGICMFLGASGLWLFMAYQWIELGSPFRFIQAQIAWRSGEPVIPTFLELITLYHIWFPLLDVANYRLLGASKLILNHGLYTFTILLFAYGCVKRWLSQEEVFACICMFMLFYYYVLNLGESQWSTGRYSMLFIPCYLILSRILLKWHRSIFMTLLTAFTILLCFYTILFVQWRAVY